MLFAQRGSTMVPKDHREVLKETVALLSASCVSLGSVRKSVSVHTRIMTLAPTRRLTISSSVRIKRVLAPRRKLLILLSNGTSPTTTSLLTAISTRSTIPFRKCGRVTWDCFLLARLRSTHYSMQLRRLNPPRCPSFKINLLY